MHVPAQTEDCRIWRRQLIYSLSQMSSLQTDAGCRCCSILHVMNVNIQPLLAVGGVGGIAVGFGAQVCSLQPESELAKVCTGSQLQQCARLKHTLPSSGTNTQSA